MGGVRALDWTAAGLFIGGVAVAYVALIGGFLGAMGFLWWAAGRSPRAGSDARRSSSPAKRTTAVRAGGELANVGSAAQAAEMAAPAIAAPAAPVLRLLDDSDLPPDVASTLTALADALPRPRSVLVQLLQAGDDPAELARFIATDPATAALLLRTVNSAQFALSQEISSVQHAITYLGANLVRDVALHHAMAVPVDTRNLTAERIYQALWRDSYLASGIALALAQRRGWPSPSVVSTQALLYRLGDIALVSRQAQLAALYSTDPDLADLVDRTQQELGFNSAMVGAHLAQVWGLPNALRGLLRRSLVPLVSGPQALDEDLRLGVTVGYFSSRLAQALSRQVDFDLPAALRDMMARAEAHYLPGYLAAIGLTDPQAVLGEPAIERRLAGLVARR